MPLITVCPKCETQFVVTEEQLAAYKGKVRCGTCQHVFNAKEHIVEGEEKSNKTISGDTATEKVASLLKNVSLDEQEGDDLSLSLTKQKSEVNTITLDDEKEPHISAIDTTTVLDTPSSTEPAVPKSPSPVKDLSIDDRLNAISKKKKKRFNWLLAFVVLLLLLALLAQLAYFFRTEVISHVPQTKPWYQLACKEIGCKLSLAKKIGLLTIDDSGMQEHLERENVLQFSSTLINHATYPQAYPNVVLTLTDTDDKPILRRVLKPTQYLDPSIKITQGIAKKSEVRIKLNLTTEDIPVAGYRVALTY